MQMLSTLFTIIIKGMGKYEGDTLHNHTNKTATFWVIMKAHPVVGVALSLYMKLQRTQTL